MPWDCGATLLSMANENVIALGDLRWVIEHVPMPTPARGTVVRVPAPSGNDVELRVDMRKFGDLEWVYEGPLLLDGDHAGDPGDGLGEWLRIELGPRCLDVHLDERRGGSAKVRVVARAGDASSAAKPAL
jgi:hypothetical protein